MRKNGRELRVAMDIIERECYITKEQDHYINNVLQGSSFPWFFTSNTTSYKYSSFSHTLVKRSFDKDTEGVAHSPHLNFFLDIFNYFCFQNNITCKRIYRAAVNNTSFMPEPYGDPHFDHEFPHSVFLLYLNTFSNGSTFIFSEDTKLLYKTTPKKYNAVMFPGYEHAQGFCLPWENRILCIITFI